MEFDGPLHFDTLLQHFGEDKKYRGAVSPPIVQTSTFLFDTIEEFQHANFSNPPAQPFYYSRLGNPTLHGVEVKMAELEGCEAAKLFGTGMGAIMAVIMQNVQSGSHVVAVDTCYGTTKNVLETYLPRFGVSHTYVEGSNADEVIAAVKPETTLIYLESPSSLLFRLQDLEKITSFAKSRGIATLHDNTYSTPLYQNPAKLGIDYVIHSGTKYLAGHSDTCSGVVCSTKDNIVRMTNQEVNYFGSICSPLNAWLVHRGLRTLSVRLRHAQEAGNFVADFLSKHPKIERIFHVGHESFTQNDLYKKQMSGTSGLLSFILKDQSFETTKAFVESLKMFRMGVSWGGHECLVVPLLIKPLGFEKETYVIRIYCGLEHPTDMVADLTQALNVVP